jgi:hypothetical protein
MLVHIFLLEKGFFELATDLSQILCEGILPGVCNNATEVFTFFHRNFRLLLL